MRKDCGESSEELQTIIDASPIMIFYKDKENRFIRVNKALADATGLPKEAIEGKTTFEIYPHYAEKYWEDDKEVISSGQPKTNIIEPVELKGSTRWAQTDKIPYRDEKGHIIGIIGFAVDITERKQAEEKLKQRLDDLEQFRKVTIQREIRMRALKDRVAELEKEIEKCRDAPLGRLPNHTTQKTGHQMITCKRFHKTKKTSQRDVSTYITDIDA